jgi:hypothetical protein
MLWLLVIASVYLLVVDEADCHRRVVWLAVCGDGKPKT